MINVGRWKSKTVRWCALAGTAVAVLLALGVECSFYGHSEGLYLLHGRHGKPLELANDLFLGEEEFLIAGFDLPSLTPSRSATDEFPRLEIEWDAADGNGYVTNFLGGERRLVTNFSRYRDSDDRHTHGLFIGGATPVALRRGAPAQQNESGMTFFDGADWRHIWCNTNEGLGSAVTTNRYGPSAWEFLGSRIERESPQELVVRSSHRVALDGNPLQIERTTRFVAGEPYLLLTVDITNVGSQVSRYYYYYGDEPWLGDFGTSAGDVGWGDGRIYEYEDVIDPKRVSFAGMADFGSTTIGEGHAFSHVANFIEWLGPDRPDVVFFANKYDGFAHSPQVRVPLQGDARSIGMYWLVRELPPGASRRMSLAIGMAGVDGVTGLPVKPRIDGRQFHAGTSDPARSGAG